MLCLMESHLVHIRKNTKFLDDVETFRNVNLLERMMSWFYTKLVMFIFGATAPPVGQDLLIHEVSRSHTKKHHSR